MRYITITTPDNIEIEYRLAGAGSRAAAAATDFLIQILLYAALAVPAVFIFLGGPDSLRDLGKLGWGAGALLAVLFIILFGYYIVSELLLNGRTPGKIIFGLRAIRENGMPVSFLHSLIRNIFKLTVDIFGVGFFLALLTKKQRRVGDIVASTVVVAEPPPFSIEIESLEYETPGAPEGCISLTREEARLLKDYLKRKKTFADGGASAHKKIAEYLSQKYDAPENIIDDDYILRLIGANIY